MSGGRPVEVIKAEILKNYRTLASPSERRRHRTPHKAAAFFENHVKRPRAARQQREKPYASLAHVQKLVECCPNLVYPLTVAVGIMIISVTLAT